MADIAQLGIKVDSSGVKSGTAALGGMAVAGAKTEKSVGKLEKSFEGAGKTAQKLGAVMSAAVTLPLLALSKAAITASNKLNRGFGKVATLIPGDTAAVKQLRAELLLLSDVVGVNTGDLTPGVFDLISALGVGKENMENFTTATRASIGGFASAAESVALVTKVTAAFGDQSSIAQKKVLDLAFTANRVGVTDFKDMANAVGQSAAVFADLGATVEEFFAVFATGTKVFKDANVVTTQLAAITTSLNAPTGDLVKLFEELGVSSGRALISQFGLARSFIEIKRKAEETGKPLRDFLGSAESVRLVTALAGASATTFAEANKSMVDALGASDQAFNDAVNGIDKTGRAMDKVETQIANVTTRIGIGLEPTVLSLIQTITPLLDKIRGLSIAFANADTDTQRFVTNVGLIVAALGPILIVLGTALRGFAVIALRFTAIGIGITAAAAIVVVIFNNLNKFKPLFEKLLKGIESSFDKFVESMQAKVKRFSDGIAEGLSNSPLFSALKDMKSGIESLLSDDTGPAVGSSELARLGEEAVEFIRVTDKALASNNFDKLPETMKQFITATRNTIKIFAEGTFDLPPEAKSDMVQSLALITAEIKKAEERNSKIDIFNFDFNPSEFFGKMKDGFLSAIPEGVRGPFIAILKEFESQIKTLEDQFTALTGVTKQVAPVLKSTGDGVELFEEKIVGLTDAQKEAERVAKLLKGSMASLKEQFTLIEAKAAILGDSIDPTADKLALLRQEIEKLVDEGITKGTKGFEKFIDVLGKLERDLAKNEVNTALNELKATMVAIDRQAQLFGSGFDGANEKILAFKSTIKNLVASGTPELTEQIRGLNEELKKLENIKALEAAAKAATDAIRANIRDVGQTISSTVTTMVDGVLRGTQSMKEAFKDLGKNIILAFTSKAINRSINGIFDSIANGVDSQSQTAQGRGSQIAQNVRGASRDGGLGGLIGASTSTTQRAASGFAAGGLAANGAQALGGAAAGFGFGSLAGSFLGSRNNNATDFSKKGALAGGIAGGAIGSIIPILGTTIGAALGTALGIGVGAAIGGISQKETRSDTLRGAAIGSVVPGLGTIIGAAIGAIFGGKGKKAEISALTSSDGRFGGTQGAFGFVSTRGSRGGGAAEGAVKKAIIDIDNAIAVRLTEQQTRFVKTALSGVSLNEKSRKVQDAASEVIFERLQFVVNQVGKSLNLQGDLSSKLLQGDKFSPEKLEGVLQALDFINNFDDANKRLASGLADVTETATTAARTLALETAVQIRTFKDEVKRLGLPIKEAEASTRKFVEIFIGLSDAAPVLSVIEQELETVQARFRELAPLMTEVGLTSADAARGLARVLDNLRTGFDDELKRQLLEFKSPITNTLNDLFAVQAGRISDAQQLGGNLGTVAELIGQELKSVTQGLDSESARVATALINANINGLTGVFSTTQIDTILGSLSTALVTVVTGLKEFRDSLFLGSFSTLSPEQKFLEAESAFNKTSSLALGGNAEAVNRLQSVSQDFLQANQEFFASSNPGAFNRVIGVLDQVIGGGLSTQSQLNATAANIDILQTQLGVEQASFSTQVANLDEMGRLISGQQEQTIVLKDIVNATDIQTATLAELAESTKRSIDELSRSIQQEAGVS